MKRSISNFAHDYGFDLAVWVGGLVVVLVLGGLLQWVSTLV